MKKLLFVLVAGLALASCDNLGGVNEPQDYRQNFVGTYTLSGEGKLISTVTNSQSTYTDESETFFSGKTMTIKLDPTNSQKLIIEWSQYQNTTATVKNSYALSIDDTKVSFVDDGSLMGKGGAVTSEISYPGDAVLKDGVLTFSSILELTEVNPKNGAVLYINQVVKNTAVKR